MSVSGQLESWHATRIADCMNLKTSTDLYFAAHLSLNVYLFIYRYVYFIHENNIAVVFTIIIRNHFAFILNDMVLHLQIKGQLAVLGNWSIFFAYHQCCLKSNWLRLQSLTYSCFSESSFSPSHNVFKDPRRYTNHKKQNSHSFFFFLFFSTSQAAEHKREPANSHLHSNSLHGAQCSRANGQLRGESCDGNTWKIWLMGTHISHSYHCTTLRHVHLVFGALLTKPWNSFLAIPHVWNFSIQLICCVF